ncbi:MAG: hypothetical protein QOK15_2765 [Nocardioidaceae bacterium]|nr:hypothetical protein [Nocardioidaceae bacterium]
MTPVAGIDIGNATTEVVIGHREGDEVRVLAAGRAPTRRGKGSPESLDGAARLLRRLERRHGVQVARAVAAPLRPVLTGGVSLPEATADTGRLWVVGAGSETAGGQGFGAGRPVLLGRPVGDGPVVVVVPSRTGYVAAAEAVSDLLSRTSVTAVLLESDEAVLVSHRLPESVPVVDEVPVEQVLGAEVVAVEVSSGGRPLQVLTDPFKLRTAVGLSQEELGHAARLAPLLFDTTNAVVGVGGAPPRRDDADGWIELADGRRLPFLAGHEEVASGTVGAARGYAVPPHLERHDVGDLWSVDLAAVARAVQARRASARSRPVGIAALRASAPYVDPSDALADLLGVPVVTVASEASAARAGALSTPGAGGDVVVVDLGGGTIDAMTSAREVVAAGAGDLVTTAVAALTGTTNAAAEWVKRGPAGRVEAPQVLLLEDGSRSFLERPAARETIGSLVVDGPAGMLPFSRSMAPGEWRALRLRVKVDVVGGNIARALRTLSAAPGAVVVVGGSAGDEEVLSAVSGALPAGTVVARGNVGGRLGHRYAVAYGLLLLT